MVDHPQPSSVYNRYSTDAPYSQQAGPEYSELDMALFSRTATVRRCQHTDWELCERVRLQELNEARDRAAQMEKTMRWWSECTANWRSKWSTVRDERNRAREESHAMRDALDEANERIEAVNRAKRVIELELARAESALHRVKKEQIISKVPEPEIVPIRKMNCGVEAKPTTMNEYTQTDDQYILPRSASLSSLQSTRRVQIAPKFDRDPHKPCFEARVASLETELLMANAKCAELEAAKGAAVDEIEDLRRHNEEILRKATKAEQKELEKARSETEEIRAEADALREENEKLMQQIRELQEAAAAAAAAAEAEEETPTPPI
ncbi:hypothetical protein PMAYCL1PPCAC_24676 [Pristionchus mayeri]|uniref:Coiled-coil domain-containing protein 102A n=1 Tax=Pristionchus mayeri TaxID=1317129 RepID=A0AAN5I8U1_9BILA|nr:hypothetical protein PMAYCL1PPCAC_24676 [Pristionchus mayeri]